MAKKSAQAVVLDPAMRLVVLYGKERFLIQERTRRFAELLEKQFGGLEQFNFDGETVQPAALLDELRSYGLMQKHKLVILDHAESFLAGGGKGATEDDDDDDDDAAEATAESGGAAAISGPRRPLMERYAESPVPDATLLMRASTWRTGKLDKLIAKAGGAIYQCELLDDEKAADWCVKRCAKRHDATLAPAAAALLVRRLGPELQHLDTELTRLATMANATPGGAITPELVAQAIGLSREERAWEIQSAIVTGSPSTMLSKLRELIDISRQDIVPLNWAISDLLRKLHTAAQMLRRGLSSGAVRGQLKLWGDTTEPILAIAGRTDPSALAQLLQAALETDVRSKSGVGDPQRSLEALMVQIADTIGREPSNAPQRTRVF